MIYVAIVGAGAIAGIHADAFSMFPDLCQVKAVCDIYPDKAEQLIQTKHLSQAHAYSSIEDALKEESLDLVSICLPPFSHTDATILAMEAGCHVLVEKPIFLFSFAFRIFPNYFILTLE